MICNIDEYKKMVQDLSLGQLYGVHSKIYIYKHWLGLLIYYDTLTQLTFFVADVWTAHWTIVIDPNTLAYWAHAILDCWARNTGLLSQ